MNLRYFYALAACGLMMVLGACKGHGPMETTVDSATDATADSMAAVCREDSLRMEGIRTCDLTLLELHGCVKEVVEELVGGDRKTTYAFSPEGRLLTVNGKDPFHYVGDGSGEDYVEFGRDKQGHIVSMCWDSRCLEVVWDEDQVWKMLEYYDETAEMEMQLTTEDNGIVVRTLTMERENGGPWERTGQDRLEHRLDAYGNWTERTDIYGNKTVRRIVYY